MDHETARVYASARHDGELDARSSVALDEHLSSCADCAAFAEGLAGLSTLVAAMPRVEPSPAFAERVTARLRRPARARRPARLRRRFAPAFGAVAALVVAVLLLPSATMFALPRAEASEALLEIETLFVDREITTTSDDTVTRTRERIWFRAPATYRIERTIIGPSGRSEELDIVAPGETYRRTAGPDEQTEMRRVNVPPDEVTLPEPLTPTIALIGRRLGPGPDIAGRPTVRIEAVLPDERVVAFVDARRFTLVGSEPSVVVAKDRSGPADRRVAKRALEVRFNEPLSSGLFDIPSITPVDDGFTARDASELRGTPAAVPEGFRLVAAGEAPNRSVLLYASGAFQLTVSIGAEQPVPGSLRRSARVSGRPATVHIDLFSPPVIVFDLGGERVALRAPLPPEQLAVLASAMFPA